MLLHLSSCVADAFMEGCRCYVWEFVVAKCVCVCVEAQQFWRSSWLLKYWNNNSEVEEDLGFCFLSCFLNVLMGRKKLVVVGICWDCRWDCACCCPLHHLMLLCERPGMSTLHLCSSEKFADPSFHPKDAAAAAACPFGLKEQSLEYNPFGICFYCML